MYASRNFKTKKEMALAVVQYVAYMEALKVANEKKMPDRQGYALSVVGLKTVPMPVTLYAHGLGSPVHNGTETVSGPHFPAPHKWYANVEVVDGIVVKVK
jgi:hypothetical protein